MPAYQPLRSQARSVMCVGSCGAVRLVWPLGSPTCVCLLPTCAVGAPTGGSSSSPVRPASRCCVYGWSTGGFASRSSLFPLRPFPCASSAGGLAGSSTCAPWVRADVSGGPSCSRRPDAAGRVSLRGPSWRSRSDRRPNAFVPGSCAGRCAPACSTPLARRRPCAGSFAPSPLPVSAWPLRVIRPNRILAVTSCHARRNESKAPEYTLRFARCQPLGRGVVGWLVIVRLGCGAAPGRAGVSWPTPPPDRLQ